jgi:hypothetical protein
MKKYYSPLTACFAAVCFAWLWSQMMIHHKVPASSSSSWEKSHPLCHARGVHIAQSNNVVDEAVSMTVSFTLDFKLCASKRPVTVLYGRGIRVEGSVTSTTPLHFNYTSDFGSYSSDWIYHLELPGLQAGLKKYWYRIIVPQGLRRGTTRRFRTPPLPGWPTKLALIGDLGQTENSTATAHHILQGTLGEEPISHVLIAGDMSYADSDPHRWTSWFDKMEFLAKGVPIHVAAGNHEIECDTKNNRLFVPYENLFRNPNRIKDAEMEPIDPAYKKELGDYCTAPSDFHAKYDYGNAFYSYQHGLATIVVLNSYSNSSKGSAQYEWLAEELSAVDRSQTPWLLVAFHAPLYTSFQGHVNESQSMAMKESMEPLFNQYGVNLIISGHDHAYLRTFSLDKNKVDPTGMAPVYVTLGAGGNREHHSAGYLPRQPWVAQRTLVDYGYGFLNLRNATHGYFSWIRDGISKKGGIHDAVWLHNPHALVSS